MIEIGGGRAGIDRGAARRGRCGRRRSACAGMTMSRLARAAEAAARAAARRSVRARQGRSARHRRGRPCTSLPLPVSNTVWTGAWPSTAAGMVGVPRCSPSGRRTPRGSPSNVSIVPPAMSMPEAAPGRTARGRAASRPAARAAARRPRRDRGSPTRSSMRTAQPPRSRHDRRSAPPSSPRPSRARSRRRSPSGRAGRRNRRRAIVISAARVEQGGGALAVDRHCDEEAVVDISSGSAARAAAAAAATASKAASFQLLTRTPVQSAPRSRDRSPSSPVAVERLRHLLAELDAELVERVDAEQGGIGEGAVLVKGDQRAQASPGRAGRAGSSSRAGRPDRRGAGSSDARPAISAAPCAKQLISSWR